MTLLNAFGALALDQSVMSTTPLLKNINTTLQSTPYVYVVNDPLQTVLVVNPATPFGVQNVNIANPATPPAIQNVSLLSTPIVISYQGSPYTVIGTVGISNFPQGFNVNVANPSTPPTVQNVNVVQAATPLLVWQLNQQSASGVTNVNLANVSTPPSIQSVSLLSTPIVYSYQGNANYNVAITSTPIVAAYISSMPAISVTANPPVMQNINFAEQATPVIVYLQSTPIVSAVISSMPAISVTSTAPGMQNVNIANVSTPPTIQNVAITSTPIVYSYQPSPYFVTGTVTSNVTFPGIQNVNLANVSTPPPVQAVSITSTPVVSILNTNVGINNWPASQTVFVSNFATPQPVSIVQQTTPLQVVVTGHPATPVVLAQLASNQINLAGTPIVYSYQPYPYSVNVGNLPTTQNVNVVQAATPLLVNVKDLPLNVLLPFNQSIYITGATTPVYTVPIPGTAWPVSITQQTTPLIVTGSLSTSPPVMQNVNFAQQATPVQTVLTGQTTPIIVTGSLSTTAPVMQNINFAQQATPIIVSFINTPGQATPTVNAIVDGPIIAQISNTSQPTGSTALAIPVNIVQAATPQYVNVQNVTATPWVYTQIVSEPIAQSYLTATWYAGAGQCTPVLYTGTNNILVKSLTCTSTLTAIGPIAFQTTPSFLLVGNPSQVGMSIKGIGSRQMGVPSPVVNLTGPSLVGAGVPLGIPAVGDAGNFAFWLGMGTPLFAWNCSGHISYALV